MPLYGPPARFSWNRTVLGKRLLRTVTSRKVAFWPRPTENPISHSIPNGIIVAARPGGIQVHRVRSPAAAPEAALTSAGGRRATRAGRRLRGSTRKGRVAVDGDRNLPKRAAEFDRVLRVLVRVVDYRGRDLERSQRLRRCIRVLVSG